MIQEKTPYFNLQVGRTDATGFDDLTAQEIQHDIAKSQIEHPDVDPF